MYEIIFSKTAKTQLTEIDKKIQEKIINTLKRIRIRPHAFIIKLVGLPLFKLKVGKYRVIISIDDNKLIILIVQIGLRKNIYKKL